MSKNAWDETEKKIIMYEHRDVEGERQRERKRERDNGKESIDIIRRKRNL